VDHPLRLRAVRRPAAGRPPVSGPRTEDDTEH
jgi:hypothetical protein